MRHAFAFFCTYLEAIGGGLRYVTDSAEGPKINVAAAAADELVPVVEATGAYMRHIGRPFIERMLDSDRLVLLDEMVETAPILNRERAVAFIERAQSSDESTHLLGWLGGLVRDVTDPSLVLDLDYRPYAPGNARFLTIYVTALLDEYIRNKARDLYAPAQNNEVQKLEADLTSAVQSRQYTAARSIIDTLQSVLETPQKIAVKHHVTVDELVEHLQENLLLIREAFDALQRNGVSHIFFGA